MIAPIFLIAWLLFSPSSGPTMFLGDSITAGLPVREVVPSAINYAVSGQRTEHLLGFMPTYAGIGQAQRVVIMVGTNDILIGRAARLGAQYRDLLKAVPADVPVLLCSVPPIDIPSQQLRGAVELARESARAACSADPRCRFVDTFAVLTREGDPLPGVLSDGVHFTLLGYERWIAALKISIAQESPPHLLIQLKKRILRLGGGFTLPLTET